VISSRPLPLIDFPVRFLSDLVRSRSLIADLAVRDFTSRYLGSTLGLAWAFIHPTCTVLILWFVFEQGFKSKPVANVPFVLWMLTGMVPWFFFSEALGAATGSVMEHAYLVRKVRFRVSVLPLVKLISASFVHLFFIGMTFLLFTAYGLTPTLHSLQVVYYTGACAVLLLGLSYATSSLVLFFKDLQQIVQMALQFGFWLTPIFWTVDMLPERYRLVIRLNPMQYIVQGYRESFIDHVWFWEHPWQTAWFWGVTAACFACGAFLFRRLRPHFADVL
jgi:ABC-type polysaccharide/polyol phosphate export permease